MHASRNTVVTLPRWHPVPPPDVRPTRDRLVITIVIGDDAEELHEATGPSQRAYADRLNADYTVIRGATQDRRMICAEKWRVKDYVPHYPGGTVYLDVDVFVMPDAPDLLNVTPPDSIGMVDISSRMSAIIGWAEGMAKKLCDTQGIPLPPFEQKYWNSGVWVGRPEHAAYWEPPPRPYPTDWCTEELWCRLTAQRLGMPIHDLSGKFNWTWNTDRDFIQAFTNPPHFWHFCGMGSEQANAVEGWKQDNQVWRKSILRLLNTVITKKPPEGNRPMRCKHLVENPTQIQGSLRTWHKCDVGFGSVTNDGRAGYCCACHSAGTGIWRVGVECGEKCPGYNKEFPGGKSAALLKPQQESRVTAPWEPWVDEGEIKWAYGVTTVPSRRHTTLPGTLRSLVKAGFPTPHLFIDGDDDGASWRREFDVPVTARGVPTKAYGNWITALWELFTRDREATRFVIFQDDMLACQDIRQYLEGISAPKAGYLNLFVYRRNFLFTKGVAGWQKSDQRGRGAVGLVFPRPVVQRLLASQHLVDRVLDPKRGDRGIDGGVADAAVKAGVTEWVHNPSFLTHTGTESAIGNRKHPPTPNFIGEGVSALTLLKPPDRT